MPLSIHNRQRTVTIQTRVVKKRMVQMMAYLGCADHDVSAVLGSDRLLRRLNCTYRQKDYPTNVLAFPQQPTYVGEPEMPGVLGDVIVSLPTAAREAQVLQQALEERVVYLFLHGLLHLLGYDHEHSPAQRRRMERRERKVLAYLQAHPL